MRVKRVAATLLAVAVLALAGCGAKQEKKPEAQPAAAPAAEAPKADANGSPTQTASLTGKYVISGADSTTSYTVREKFANQRPTSRR